MNQSFGYKGTVNITSFIGDDKKIEKSFKNGGTNLLFLMIARYLSGANVPAPIAYIDIVDKTSRESVVSGDHSVSKWAEPPSDSNKGGALHVTTSIPYNSIIIPDGYGEDEKCLAVLKASDKSILAEAEIVASILKSVTKGRQALLDWVMEFTNIDGGNV